MEHKMINKILKKVLLFPFNIIYKFYPKFTVKLIFALKTGFRGNIENPKTFNEKINWMKLYYRNELIPLCSDKFTVRQYIKNKGCENLLVKLLWQGYDPNDIPFDELPNQFVLKVTHGSKYIIKCKDKKNLNRKKTIKQLTKWLNDKYIPCYGEWNYNVVKPSIICEEYLVDESGYELKDYKIFCINGIPKIIKVDFDRNIHGHKKNVYDLNWNYISENISNKIINKPINLDKMLKYAKILSKDFIQVRVDFYIVFNKIYFGELTFFHGSGYDDFNPKRLNNELGNWIQLPNKLKDLY